MNSLSPIVVLAPRMTDDSKSIWKACMELGWTTERVQGWRVPEHLVASGRQILIYGEPLFAEAIADQMGLVLLEPSIDWLTTVPRHYLQRDIEIMTLAAARERMTEAFVKPADGKIFDPMVYASGAKLPSDEHVDLDIPVIRSGVVDFRLEVRCFVRGRQIVTMSPYWREGALAQDAQGGWPFQDQEEMEAVAFASSVLEDRQVSLPPACTLDVGRLADGSWAIIEANPCWGAGLYGCDPAAVLSAIGTAILPRKSITAADKPWISKRRQTILENKS